MDVAITTGAFAFLALLALYLMGLGVGYTRQHTRQQTVARRTAVLEHDLLVVNEARIGQIMDRRKFERARQELSWNGFRKFEIARKEKEGGGICSFYLSPHDRKPLPPFEPGQYLTFNLHVPDQPKPVVRCYSLS